jgi:hypothetical protein
LRVHAWERFQSLGFTAGTGDGAAAFGARIEFTTDWVTTFPPRKLLYTD